MEAMSFKESETSMVKVLGKHTVCCQGDAGSGHDALEGPNADDECSRCDEHGENIITEEAEEKKKNYREPQNTAMHRRRSWHGSLLLLALIGGTKLHGRTLAGDV